MGRMIWDPETGQFKEQYVLPMPPSVTEPEPEPEPTPVADQPRESWQPVTTADVERRKTEEEAYREAKRKAREPEPVEAPPLNPLEQGLIAHGKYDIATRLYTKRTGIKLDGKPLGARDYLGKSEDITGFGFDKEPEFEPRPEPKKTPLDIEREAGKQAGITAPTIVAEKQKARYETYLYQQRVLKLEEEAIRRRMAGKEGIPGHLYEFSRLWYTGLTPENILWQKQIGEFVFGKEEEKGERLLRGYAESITAAQKRWKTTGPTGLIGEPFMPGGLGFMFGTTFALSAGIGAVSAAYPTIGKVTQVGIAGYGAYSIATSEDPYKSLLRAGVTLPFILFGYRKGFRFGYGRTEQYLYKIHTYTPGTPEYIRFEQAMKVGRLLHKVSPIKRTPLDFAKDIMRMDPKTSQAFIKYYATYKGVIGGSAASRTQVIGARQPRDIDYFMQRILLGTEKKVALAKGVLPTKKTIFVHGKPKTVHLIDIHGKEMYYPGKYHRFGFVSQRPVKIDGYKYFTAGEQLFRKGVASVVKEAQYRWFKDIPDFVTHAKSQILSLRGKVSPLAQWKVARAEVALELFLHPEKAVGYGKADLGFIGRFFKATTKPVQPKPIIKPWGFDYEYPPSAYPSYIAPIGISSYLVTPSADYLPSVVSDYKPSVVKPSAYPSIAKPDYKPSVVKPGYQPVYISKPVSDYIPAKQLLHQPTYQPPTKPPSYPPSYEPPYQPPTKPPSYPPDYPPSYVPPYKPTLYIDTDQLRLVEKPRKQGYHVYVKERYIEHGKKVRPERLVKISKVPSVKSDAMGLLGSAIDNSAAMQGKIVPTKGTPKEPTISFTPWSWLQHKFTKQGDVYKEKRQHAIDTSGEIREITAKGWMAEQRQVQDVVSRKKPKAVKEKQIVPEMQTIYDIDMDKLMNKMFKGMGF